MITLGELTALAAEDGVAARTVERDYVISHVMASVATTPACGSLQFKGGTAIRLCHEPTYRYSADIDLNVLDGSESGALAAIEDALSLCSHSIGLPHLSLISGGTLIEYEGPTGRGNRTLKLDLDVDEYVQQRDHRLPILHRYSDQTTTTELLVYEKGEILAEKFRCVMQRLQSRDLYDIWWLTRNAPPDLGAAALLFAEKARHRDLDPTNFSVRFEARSNQYEERWSDELYRYLDDPPHFDQVLREVRRTLRQSGLL